MTITESDLRTALRRAADQADLRLDPMPPVATVHHLQEPGPRRQRLLAVAAVLVAVAAIVAVTRSSSEQVRTERGGETTAPQSTPTTAASVAGTVPPAPSTVTVQVLNGSGTSTNAGDLTGQLAAAGYQTLAPDNALDLIDPTRVFYAPGFEVAAQDLAARIGRQDVQPLPVRPLGVGGAARADLVVVVGRDWTPGPLVVPDPGQTYATTTTAPPSGDRPAFVLWAGTEDDADQRTTPEGTLRALIAAVDPTIEVDDVTVTAGRHSGWQAVTARVGGVYVVASTAPQGDRWVISGLDDVDHPDLSSALLGTDGRLVVPMPAGTVSAVALDLGLDPIRSEQFPEPGTPTTLDQITDQPATGFEFAGEPATEVADHLVIGRDASGAITTIFAFKIGP